MISIASGEKCKKFTLRSCWGPDGILLEMESYLHWVPTTPPTTPLPLPLSRRRPSTPDGSPGPLRHQPHRQRHGGRVNGRRLQDLLRVMAVRTFNISGYTGTSIVPRKLSFEVWDTAAEASGNAFRMFAKVKVKIGTVNHVWLVGPSVSMGLVSDGVSILHSC